MQFSISTHDLWSDSNNKKKLIPVSIIRSRLAHAARTTTKANDVANAFDTTAAAFVLTIPHFAAVRKANTIPNTRISKMKTEGSHIMVPAWSNRPIRSTSKKSLYCRRVQAQVHSNIVSNLLNGIDLLMVDFEFCRISSCWKRADWGYICIQMYHLHRHWPFHPCVARKLGIPFDPPASNRAMSLPETSTWDVCVKVR
jgi:hypothetical protein